MKPSPKLLPWLARKAGLSQEKAEALWRDTFANESFTKQYANNPDAFLHRVLEYFQQVAAQQSAHTDRTTSSHAAPSRGKRTGSDPAVARFALA